MISLQTNVTSLDAQNNLNTDNLAQGKTIQQLSSGYRINSSGDDAAGLAVANQYRDNIAELTQGVNNASTGIAQLQIVDGGLSNISTILDRMKTLATESASGTFTGNRATLDTEYQGLISEISRQAANINLNQGGSFNSVLNVYIGGASTLANAGVSIDLSGNNNAVDAAALGLTGTNVNGGTVGGVGFDNTVNVGFGSNSTALNGSTSFLANSTQTYTFNYVDSSGSSQTKSITLNGGADGIDGNAVISQLNTGLAGTGITASINSSDGTVQFSGSNSFTAGVAAVTGSGASTVTAANTLVNTAQYNLTTAGGTFTAITGTETFTISNGTKSANVTLNATNGDSLADEVTAINSALQSAGMTDVTALASGDNKAISFQSASNFSVVQTAAATDGSLFTGTGSETVTAGTAVAAERLDNPATEFLKAGTQTFTFNYADSNGNTQTRSVVVSGGTDGIDGNSVISQLNSGLTGTGITASISATDGTLQFTSTNAFTAGAAAATAGTGITGKATLVNQSEYNVSSMAAFTGAGNTLSANDSFTISDGNKTANISLTTADTLDTALTKIQSALTSAGITDVTAIANGDDTAISFQGSANFSITDTTVAGGGSGSPLFSGLTNGVASVNAPLSGGTAGTNASAAIDAINAAIQTLGLVQGRVGAGENLLQYATNLANSQITNFSTAQSDIRDADVAADASKLTQGQVLEQTAVAAMAQANSSAEVVLKLLQ